MDMLPTSIPVNLPMKMYKDPQSSDVRSFVQGKLDVATVHLENAFRLYNDLGLSHEANRARCIAGISKGTNVRAEFLENSARAIHPWLGDSTETDVRRVGSQASAPRTQPAFRETWFLRNTATLYSILEMNNIIDSSATRNNAPCDGDYRTRLKRTNICRVTIISFCRPRVLLADVSERKCFTNIIIGDTKIRPATVFPRWARSSGKQSEQ